MDYTEPASPWAEHYGTLLTTKFNERHPTSSGLAPEYPRLDPKYHARIPNVIDMPTSPDDVDTLFYSEALQHVLLDHVKSWECSALRSELTLQGNPNPISSCQDAESEALIMERFKRERIQVNEAGWFPFFRKDRWHDMKAMGQMRSVDNEEIWENLRVCIELADRVLKALLNQRNEWLMKVLWGPIITLREHHPRNEWLPNVDGKLLLLGPQAQREWLGRVNPALIPHITYGEQLDARVSWEKMLTHLEKAIWGFLDEGYHDAWGITIPRRKPEGHFNQIILMDWGLLQSLSTGDLTVSETCDVTWQFASTMIHEVMHAFMSSRLLSNDDLSPNAIETYYKHLTEPFIDDDSLAELGHSWENAVLGGFSNTRPTRPILRGPGDHRALPYKPYVKPGYTRGSMGYADTNRSIVYRAGICRLTEEEAEELPGVSHAYHTPSSFHYMLLSAAYWDQVGPKNFAVPDVFVATDDAFQFLDVRGTAVNQGSNYYQIHRNIVDKWNEKQQLWARARGDAYSWGGREWKVWSKTAWGWAPTRHRVEEFAEDFRQRDEHACRRIAEAMLSHEVEVDPTAVLPPVKWIYHVIGLLMLAVIPIRTKNYIIPGTARPVDCHPSMEAARTARLNIHRVLFHKPDKELVRSTLDGRPLVNAFEPLNEAWNVMKRVENSRTLMPFTWLEELRVATNIIWEDRLEMNYLPNSWCDSWPFKIPKYDRGLRMARQVEGIAHDAPFAERVKIVPRPNLPPL